MTWRANEGALKPHGSIKETDVQQKLCRMHIEDYPVIREAE
jgi:hypothetical protein